MAAYLSPVFGAGAQLFNNQGIVLSGGKIWTYMAGTTTPLGTWTDSTQLVSNANPIILDSAGRLSSEIWLQGSSTYKFILTDANDNVLGTWDNIAGLNDITTSVTVSEWTATNLTPTYISATSFSVPGNNTASFVINRRVKLVVSAGTVYGYVVSSAFTSVTTVVIQPDSTVLDSGLSSVEIGLLDSTNVSIPQQYPAFNAALTVSSATSPTPIGAALSANITISGTTTITAFDTVIAGIVRLVKFSGALTLTHNATSLILPTAANITTAANDQAGFRSLGSGNWECLWYSRASGYAFFSDSAASLQSGATAVTQAGQDNSTKIATDEYVDRQHDSQVFTTPGANTWTKPAWVMPNTLAEIECWGGGGGGGHSISAGNGGGGGGGGSYSCRRVLVSSLGATEVVTVGAAGTAGTSTSGGNGGTSSLGSVVTATGGTGGNGGAGQPGTGGAGGINNGVTVPLWNGGAGGNSESTAGGNTIFGSGGGGAGRASGAILAGGVSVYGGSGGAGSYISAAAVAGSAPGGGGGGGDIHSANGAAGARGEVRVRILS